jgi:hypothetical protein
MCPSSAQVKRPGFDQTLDPPHGKAAGKQLRVQSREGLGLWLGCRGASPTRVEPAAWQRLIAPTNWADNQIEGTHMVIVKGDDYSVEYDPSKSTVCFIGTVRLPSGSEYDPIMNVLQLAHSQCVGGTLRLDFRKLHFLNSSGINVISKFVISARKAERVKLAVVGSRDIYWHQKSLLNLQRLWSGVEIEIT